MTASASDLALRFTGADGARLLREVLHQQIIFASNNEVIDRIAKVVAVEPYNPEQVMIEQDAVDSDILFILTGTVIICVNGRDGVTRSAGTHVGELTTIDPSVKRSATVRAIEPTVIARVRESDFSPIAVEFPFLWRRIAQEIGQRLRDRVMKVPTKNVRPRIFIGSTSEGLKLAETLKECFELDPYEVKVWTDGIFVPGSAFIEALEAEKSRSDFAVLFLAPDDRVLSRWRLSHAPRDNLIFELGLFMGAINRDRALMVIPKRAKLKLPSDLDGITSIRYSPDNIETVAQQLRDIFGRLGTR